MEELMNKASKGLSRNLELVVEALKTSLVVSASTKEACLEAASAHWNMASTYQDMLERMA